MTFFLKQETVEAFAANATQKAEMIHERVSQKKKKIFEAVPLLNKIKEKISAFDKNLTERWGKNYTKVRNILTGVGKFYIAGHIGGPALVALGAINTVKALKPMLKEAEKERKEGKVTGLLDFIKKKPKECGKTMLAASLGAAVVACGLAGAANGKFISRVGIATLVVVPEIKALASTAKDWVRGKRQFKDVARDIATVGISVSAFIAGGYTPENGNAATAPTHSGGSVGWGFGGNSGNFGGGGGSFGNSTSFSIAVPGANAKLADTSFASTPSYGNGNITSSIRTAPSSMTNTASSYATNSETMSVSNDFHSGADDVHADSDGGSGISANAAPGDSHSADADSDSGVDVDAEEAAAKAKKKANKEKNGNNADNANKEKKQSQPVNLQQALLQQEKKNASANQAQAAAVNLALNKKNQGK